jgi:hypothetical protein
VATGSKQPGRRLNKMDEEFRKILIDYFTGPELVDLLEIPVEELVDLLQDYILDMKEEIDEFICYGN